MPKLDAPFCKRRDGYRFIQIIEGGRMTDAPLITIGIACYRSNDTVARAIQSALAQDWPYKELVIIDDSPGYGTDAVIREAIKGHDNARLIIHDVNRGFAGALNTIIKEAKGEFLAIFDDDDVSDPTRLSRQYDRIIEHEHKVQTKMIICHAAREQVFPNGYSRYEPTMGTIEDAVPHGKAVADRILTGRLSRGVVGSCANCSRMARIEVFRAMNGYDGTMRRAEDTDFNIRLALAGGHFVGIAEPLVTQTMTMGQEKTLQAEQAAELMLLEKHRAYLEQKGWYGFCQGWLNARYEFLNHQRGKFIGTMIKLGLRYPFKVLCKMIWIIPASPTRKDFKKWHHAKLGEANG
jgi:glycosyltransferase involved in cell wall biosynthesis